MPRLEELNNTHPNNQNTSANQSTSTSLNQLNQKEESGIIKTIGQLLPLAPFVFEQFTGQKVPQMTGTIADMQTALIQIQTGLQTIVNNQQTLNQRITNLENNAVKQLTSLTQQFQSLRLTHTREKKQIELNPSHLENNQEESY
jgi:hypothetical protein